MVVCMALSLPSAPTIFWSSVVPSALSAYTRVALFGAAPLNFDFATLSFQVPTTASAAKAVAPSKRVLNRAIVMILLMVRLQCNILVVFGDQAGPAVPGAVGEYARAIPRPQASVGRALQHCTAGHGSSA